MKPLPENGEVVLVWLWGRWREGRYEVKYTHPGVRSGWDVTKDGVRFLVKDNQLPWQHMPPPPEGQ